MSQAMQNDINVLKQQAAERDDKINKLIDKVAELQARFNPVPTQSKRKVK